MATTLVSLEEYLNTAYDPDVEYVDGAIVERNLGTQPHGRLQTLVVLLLGPLEKEGRFRVFTAGRLRTRSPRHRVPDVMLLELPYQKGKVVTDVPAVTVEILSPDDSLAEVLEKCREYHALGVPNILVLDPEARIEYRFRGHSLDEVRAAVPLRFASGNEIPFSSAELFAALDEE
jgi:Uma2 family endonuclease